MNPIKQVVSAPPSAQMSKIQKIKARIMIRHIFYATILLSLPVKEDPNCPTGYTDMKGIYFNPNFLTKIDDDMIISFLVHELMHVMFKHGLRRGSRDPRLWNVACDFAINLIMKKAGFKDIKWKLDDGKPTQWLVDDKYDGMSAELIYDDLKREQEANGGGSKYGKDGDGDVWGGVGDDLREPSEVQDADQSAELDRKITQTISAAANMARLAGKMPAEMEIFVRDMLNPAVPWQEVLRDYMLRVVHDTESWARRNRRFRHITLPARHDLRMGTLVYIGDTSGSITNEEHKRSATEVTSIATTVVPESIRLLWADTQVANEQVFAAGEEVLCEPKGGGGTDMRVPLEYAEQFDPDVVVLMTDGHTPWPDAEPPYPLIVLCTTNVDVPIGQVIRV